ncbi:MAG: sugar transferase [Bacteroidetes bacterium]|nr:sugar transferase [Bacteroidota bacterium]
MLREKEKSINNLFTSIDVFLTIVSFFIAGYIRQSSFSFAFNNEYRILFFAIIPVWFILVKIFRLSEFHRIKLYSSVFIDYVTVVLIGTSVLFLFIFTFKLEDISRIAIFIFSIIDLFVLYSFKILFNNLIKRYRRKGLNTRNMLLICDKSSKDIISGLMQAKEFGYKIVGIITKSKTIESLYGDKINIYHEDVDFENLLDTHTVDELVYCKKKFDEAEIAPYYFSCKEVGVIFRIQSQFFTMLSTHGHIDYFGEIPFYTIYNTPSNYIALHSKLILDYIFSFIILLLSAPFLLLIALLIKIDSKGPVFFKQKRIGLRKREFYVYKFRTMVNDAEKLRAKLEHKNEQDGPVFKIKNDPRITKIGRFLRKTSIDEIPQFINVLKGEMSIIGPRPPLPKEVEKYERWQLRRLSMKPGISCIWQVSGRNTISFNDWMKLDLQYIDTWSLKLDFILTIKTIRTVFRMSGN